MQPALSQTYNMDNMLQGKKKKDLLQENCAINIREKIHQNLFPQNLKS